MPTSRRYHFKQAKLLVLVYSCALLGALNNPKGAPTGRLQSKPRPVAAIAALEQPSINRVSLRRTLPKHESASVAHQTLASGEALPAFDQIAMLGDMKLFMRPQHHPQTDENAVRGRWYDVTVKTGDTLSLIFSRLSILRELQSLLKLGPKINGLNSIYPGQDLHIRISTQGMEELFFDSDDATRVSVTRTSEGEFKASVRELAVETYEVTASGIIKRSLYLDGHKAGLSDLMIMKLSKLFGWDIDFALDIRKGDAFTVIYEKCYRQGEELGDGDIIAAAFTNQGQVFRALRYIDSNGHTGYYKPSGRSVRKPFLRTPVEIAHISSPFDLHRRHPILNTIRAHRGVDYAAPTGTPIEATGDGIVVQQGTMGGYGRTITLQHGSRYTTLYGHMSRFASHTSVGEHVQQGQVIGYIGSSGLATGPHLHYEFRIDGVHHNPVTVSLPAARPLPKAEMTAFLSATKPLRAELDGFAHHRFAMR